jgi:hypothetical protein
MFLNWLMAFILCLTFYVCCGKISFKPTKQKLIVTPIFSVAVIVLTCAWFELI